VSRLTSDPRLGGPPPEEPGLFGADWQRYLSPPIAVERTVLMAFLVAGVAVCFDLAMRSGVAGAGGALCIALASGGLLASRVLRTTTSKALVAAAPLFGIWLMIRTSAWLLPFDVIAACALVGLGCSLGRGGSLWDMSVPRVGARALQAVVQAVLGPAYVTASTKGRRVAGVVRGLLLALPIVLVLALLLGSADAVFRSFIDFDIAEIASHAFLLAFGAIAMAGLFRLASVSGTEMPEARAPRLGSAEWTVVLVALDALLAAFAIARLVALSEGGRRVIDEAGLTYAEYARSGFFQLLFAAAIVIAVLAAVRAVAETAAPGHTLRLKVLSLVAVVLTLAIVVSAFQRLVLYEEVFGLTMLRLYVQLAIIWIAIVVIAFGAQLVGLGRGRTWVWSAAGITALVLLFSMNVLNPEAFVVRYNIEHQHDTARFDPAYGSELSDDAAAELASHPRLKGLVCGMSRTEFDGWAAYNVSHERAEDIRTDICKGGRP
jgi:hypothetical protein